MSIIAGGPSVAALNKIKSRAMSNVAHTVEAMASSAARGAYGDTPIERTLLLAVFMQIEYSGFRLHAIYPIGHEDDVDGYVLKAEPAWPHLGDVLFFQMQSIVVDWKADFLFAVRNFDGAVSRLYVECDGHDFHERDKDQAKRDRSRDRKIQELGFSIFRFTGSEIHSTPCECADAIVNWALNEMAYGTQKHGRFY